jgi:uncharacterized damage-inducible protein DinB
VNAEGIAFADVLERIGRGVLHELADMPEDVLNRPVPIPEGNSLFAIATHLVGAAEFWVLALAGGRQTARDRDAEFRATGTYADLEVRYSIWISDVRDVLMNLPEEAWDRTVTPPVEYTGSLGSESMTARACVLHAVEHSALHLGHIQLTRSMIASL